MKTQGKTAFNHLSCPVCGKKYNPEQLQTYCHACESPLIAVYELESLKSSLDPQTISLRKNGLWRWSELLPVFNSNLNVYLGEGSTPLLQIPHIGSYLNLKNLYLKDESSNPTGTFKARGLAMAVTKGKELGVTSFVIPTAGNAGGALAAYAARARLEAHVYMPSDAPIINQIEVQVTGAELHLIDGLITDAARAAQVDAEEHGWFDVSTFKEPYRLEGKKTMGFEIAEDFDYKLPDVIIYPTGGGTGLVGIWKAFDELEKLGWIDSHRPRMISVQAEGCAPVVRAIENSDQRIQPWENANTKAHGLRVPAVFADRLVLETIRDSHGTAIAITESDISRAQKDLARKEGIFTAPEGAATLAGLQKLVDAGEVDSSEQIVLFNTGSGLKYIY